MSGIEVRIDSSAIAHNVRVFRDLVAPAGVCAVVKADGYGHGASGAARAALAAGATWLAVATAPEAADLSEPGLTVDTPILILSERPEDEIRAAWPRLSAAVRWVVATEAGARLLDSLADQPVSVHLLTDTGMRRMGVEPSDAVGLADLVDTLPHLRLEGVCTHLAIADVPADEFTQLQLDRFESVLDRLSEAGHHPEVIHTANSAAALTRPNGRATMVRLGIAMYGISPSSDLHHMAELRPALRLSAPVTAVRTIADGESVSYGRHWTSEGSTRIATLPLGYADGIRRSSAAHGIEVLIRGRRCPIVGVVTMDQLMVAVDPDVDVGDEAVLIGRQGEHEITAEEVADRLGTIGYEIVVGLGRRLPRVHT